MFGSDALAQEKKRRRERERRRVSEPFVLDTQ
jgi:hypothetical protein